MLSSVLGYIIRVPLVPERENKGNITAIILREEKMVILLIVSGLFTVAGAILLCVLLPDVSMSVKWTVSTFIFAWLCCLMYLAAEADNRRKVK